MLSARQLLLMRRAPDRTIGVAKAPIGTVGLLPDPDFRRRVLKRVSHVGLLSLDMNRIRGRSARCRVHWSVGSTNIARSGHLRPSRQLYGRPSKRSTAGALGNVQVNTARD